MASVCVFCTIYVSYMFGPVLPENILTLHEQINQFVYWLTQIQ